MREEKRKYASTADPDQSYYPTDKQTYGAQLRNHRLPELGRHGDVEGDTILRLVCLKIGEAEIIVGRGEKRGKRRGILQPKAEVPKRKEPVAGRTYIYLSRMNHDGVSDGIAPRRKIPRSVTLFGRITRRIVSKPPGKRFALQWPEKKDRVKLDFDNNSLRQRWCTERCPNPEE